MTRRVRLREALGDPTRLETLEETPGEDPGADEPEVETKGGRLPGPPGKVTPGRPGEDEDGVDGDEEGEDVSRGPCSVLKPAGAHTTRVEEELGGEEEVTPRLEDGNLTGSPSMTPLGEKEEDS